MTLNLTAEVADVYFCGGEVACACPGAALACVQIEDVDSCDAKARAGRPCAAHAPARTSPRLRIARSRLVCLPSMSYLSAFFHVLSVCLTCLACLPHMPPPAHRQHALEPVVL